MAETQTTVKPGEALNNVLEGVSEDIKKIVFDAVEFYGKEKSEAGHKIEDMVKVNKLRNAYNTLVSALLDKLNKLNKFQRLFLTTGVLADVVEVNGTSVTLLDPGIYSVLFDSFENREKDALSEAIYTTLDKMKALAEGRIQLIDTSGKRKRTIDNSVDPKKVKAGLEWKKADSLRSGANLVREISNDFDKLTQLSTEKIKNAKLNYDVIKKYFDLLLKGHRLEPEEKKLKTALKTRIDILSKTLIEFSKMYAEIFGRTNEQMESLKEKIDDVQQKEEEIEQADTMISSEMDRQIDEFGTEHLDTIKRDIIIINNFIVNAAEKNPNRVPYSGSRIVVNSQIPDLERANDSYFCTPQNVENALKKILAIHTNAFPKDEDGRYMIPPIIIEPIRNYVDFLEDRFVMGFISGEPGKKGANVSFSPVDFQVLKAVGMYIAKDSIYNYRGEINEGTFMGDYTGKLEKKAQVKWTGEDKKFNMVISSQLVDAASRDQAVQDYMDFLFNSVNGLGPGPKMSKRRINVLLKYCVIKSVENNVKLLLSYVAQAEPTEARDTILFYTERNYDVAKEMVRKIVKEDQQVQRVFGTTNADFIINRIFV